ncbi:hypothetical protein DFH09DRAFT_1111220 [Mycena vulgaris]|nr:hypothetical protein DFH09DRAFT_1111220 [Mycena vulgaris]
MTKTSPTHLFKVSPPIFLLSTSHSSYLPSLRTPSSTSSSTTTTTLTTLMLPALHNAQLDCIRPLPLTVQALTIVNVGPTTYQWEAPGVLYLGDGVYGRAITQPLQRAFLEVPVIHGNPQINIKGIQDMFQDIMLLLHIFGVLLHVLDQRVEPDVSMSIATECYAPEVPPSLPKHPIKSTLCMVHAVPHSTLSGPAHSIWDSSRTGSSTSRRLTTTGDIDGRYLWDPAHASGRDQLRPSRSGSQQGTGTDTTAGPTQWPSSNERCGCSCLIGRKSPEEVIDIFSMFSTTTQYLRPALELNEESEKGPCGDSRHDVKGAGKGHWVVPHMFAKHSWKACWHLSLQGFQSSKYAPRCVGSFGTDLSTLRRSDKR